MQQLVVYQKTLFLTLENKIKLLGNYLVGMRKGYRLSLVDLKVAAKKKFQEAAGRMSELGNAYRKNLVIGLEYINKVFQEEFADRARELKIHHERHGKYVLKGNYQKRIDPWSIKNKLLNECYIKCADVEPVKNKYLKKIHEFVMKIQTVLNSIDAYYESLDGLEEIDAQEAVNYIFETFSKISKIFKYLPKLSFTDDEYRFVIDVLKKINRKAREIDRIQILSQNVKPEYVDTLDFVNYAKYAAKPEIPRGQLTIAKIIKKIVKDPNIPIDQETIEAMDNDKLMALVEFKKEVDRKAKEQPEIIHLQGGINHDEFDKLMLGCNYILTELNHIRGNQFNLASLLRNFEEKDKFLAEVKKECIKRNKNEQTAKFVTNVVKLSKKPSNIYKFTDKIVAHKQYRNKKPPFY